MHFASTSVKFFKIFTHSNDVLHSQGVAPPPPSGGRDGRFATEYNIQYVDLNLPKIKSDFGCCCYIVLIFGFILLSILHFITILLGFVIFNCL